MEAYKKLFYQAKEIEKEREKIKKVKEKLIQKQADLESKLSDGKEKNLNECGIKSIKTVG